MKIEPVFSPVVVTLETPFEVEIFKWMASFSQNTVRAANNEELRALLRQIENSL